MTAFDVVIPSAGRPSLDVLLAALARCAGPRPQRVVVVDDRRGGVGGGLPATRPPGWVDGALVVVCGGGRGAGAARNTGARACAAPWVAFLDDDVVVGPAWLEELARDLGGLGGDVAASQGRVLVPLPAGRRPTDWERNVAGLERARWATADMTFRRDAFEAAGGFDERFPRAYREDSDLGLRLVDAGRRIVAGARSVEHPVRPGSPWVSVRLQAGNADDALMRAVHGARWRAAAGAPPGRLRRHVSVAGAGAVAIGAGVIAAAERAPSAARRTAFLAGALWSAGTAELAWARIAPGPHTPREVATMLVTSVALPFAATWHRLRGEVRAWCSVTAARRRLSGLSPSARGSRHSMRASGSAAPKAVLLDRDGTLVVDVPYNGDPDAVVPMPGARAALDRLRAAGVALAVISNQSGVARGLVTAEQVQAVNARVEELLGPLGPWLVCPHGAADGCWCRKPAPGLVLDAARRLGVVPAHCAVIGDIGADMKAAAAAGARGILVPAPMTRAQEILAASERAPDLGAAVDVLLGAAPATAGPRLSATPAPVTLEPRAPAEAAA
ncbi:MAG TPA: HAD-IIIA family hydrolase [Solirubrobacteraceae bacterium]|nr:HAD-IIIA family hydrolase [Solirubrobacteraceae bacterium]